MNNRRTKFIVNVIIILFDSLPVCKKTTVKHRACGMHEIRSRVLLWHHSSRVTDKIDFFSHNTSQSVVTTKNNSILLCIRIMCVGYNNAQSKNIFCKYVFDW